MPYFTQAELTAFVGLDLFANLPAAEQATRLTSLQTISQSIIDSKLFGSFDVPFDTAASPMIKTLALAIAYGSLRGVFPHLPEQLVDEGNFWRDWALEELDKIANGESSLEAAAKEFRDRVISNGHKIDKRQTLGGPLSPGTLDEFLFGPPDPKPDNVI
jgi:hypothetical protein